MKKLFAIVIALVFFAGFLFKPGFADIERKVIEKFLVLGNESVKEIKEISVEGKKTYVLFIYTGNEFSGILVVDKDAELQKRGVSISALKTVLFLKKYLEIKNSIAKNPSLSWPFDKSIVYRQIKNALESKEFDLEIVSKNLDDSLAKNIVNGMKKDIKEMKDIAEALLNLSSDFINLENEFVFNTVAGSEQEVINKIKNFEELLKDFSEKIESYKDKHRNFRAIIAGLDISSEEKRSFVNATKLQQEIEDVIIGKYLQNASSIYNSLYSYYKVLDLEAVNAYKQMEERFYRAKAYELIFAENKTVEEIYGKLPEEIKPSYKISTLEQLYLFMTNDTIHYLWKDQSNLYDFKSNFEIAKNSYERRDYKKSEKFAKIAISKARKVVENGVVEFQESNELPLVYYVVLGTIFLAILYLAYKEFARQRKDEESADYY